MGPTISVNKSTANIQQNVKDQIVQRNTATCGYTCNNVADSDTQIIVNDRIGGNLEIYNFQCSTDINCQLEQSSTANLTSILAATVSQTNTPATGSFGFTLETGVNLENYASNTLNQVTQISNSTCIAQSNNTINNGYFVLANSKVGGNVVFANATGNTTGNCTIQNLSNAVAYNNDQSNTDQSNKDTGLLTMIITVVIILIIVGAIVTIFSAGIRGVTGGGKQQGELTPQQIDTISSDLAGTSSTTPATTP